MFGQVFIASHILTGENVAIKILNKAEIISADDIERVFMEIRILKKVRHPNIIQLYEIIETRKHLYLVTEYASGGNLLSYIKRIKHLSETEACRIFQQIIAAVEYLHLSGICHRDLKPENLLFDRDKHEN